MQSPTYTPYLLMGLFHPLNTLKIMITNFYIHQHYNHQNYRQLYVEFCQRYVELQKYFFSCFFSKLVLNRYLFSLKIFNKFLADPRNKLCIGSTISMRMVSKYSKHANTKTLVPYCDSS